MKNFLNGKVVETENSPEIYREGNLIYSLDSMQTPVLMGEIENLKVISAKNDLIVLLSDRITIMTSEFDIITEVDVNSVTQKSTQVALGWGSKKTQFHGSEGKQAASVEIKTAGLSADDDLEPSISWRGDGEYFVVNWVFGENRMLMIFDREGTLQNTSEPIPFLEGVVSWRPSGNLIACTQKLSHKHDVVFFERNGLRHGEFTLPDKDCHVHQLEWNIDSTTLAILISTEGKKSLQFWSSSNYHWYLVHEIKKDICSISWDSKSPLLIHTKESDCKKSLGYDFSLTIHKSNSLYESNPGTVAVIDGNILKYTPFRFVNVPPPMSNSESIHPFSILNLSFSPTSIGDAVAVLLSNQTIDFVDKVSSTAPLKREYSLDLSSKFNYIRQILWIAESKLLVLDWNSVTKADALFVIEFNIFDPDGNALKETVTEVQISSTSSIVQLYYNPNLNVISCENSEGDVFEIYENGKEWNSILKTSFGVFCSKIACCLIGGDQRVWIGLTPRNKLYLNNNVLATDCTSFEIHQEFLIITTYIHVAKFLSLKLPIEKFLFPSDPSSIDTIGFNEKNRRIEQGAKIVLVAGINLILQMPRGNLETIYPRALVLSKIHTFIAQKNYRDAFIACRKHRIDMNILIDHNPQQFCGMISEFVKQIPEVDYLNLFITGFKEEDVTKTMYNTESSTSNDQFFGGNKLNTICDLIQKTLEESKNPNYNPSILTADSKKNPPALEKAMLRISSIKANQSAEDAEKALKYLIFLVDVNSLYDVALGIYDFPLVLMVAQHSNKDPREYLPFLAELKKLDSTYQKFKIDNYLGKFSKAIGFLSQCPERTEEFLTYMDKHQLYARAMELFDCNSEIYIEILVRFAHFQKSGKIFDQAAMLFEMAGKVEEAVACYCHALLYKEAIAICIQSGIDFTLQMKELIHNLIETGRFRDAASIYIDHLLEPALGIEVLIKGGHWDEAILAAQKFKLSEVLKSKILPSMVSYAQIFVNDMNDAKDTFEKQALRLRQVRIEKTVARDQIIDGVIDDRLNDIDMMSDTSSMATTRITSRSKYTAFTGMSGKTGKTARQRRKQAKKRETGRDAAFEDEFLMKSLKSSILKVNKEAGEVKLFIRVLMTQRYVIEAKQVQTAFKERIDLIRRYIIEIFDTPVIAIPRVNAQELLEDEDEKRLKPEVIVPPQLTEEVWWIDCFS